MTERQLCGRPTRGAEAKGDTCTQAAGWGTDHPGTGACKLHGGCTPIKHGRYSEVVREKMGDAIERFREDPDLATVENEVALLRALVERKIEKGGADEEVADLVEKVVRAVDALLRHRQKFGITIDTLNRVVEQLGVAVARHVKDSDILAAIERDWSSIQLGA